VPLLLCALYRNIVTFRMEGIKMIVSHVKLSVSIPAGASEQMAEDWATGLKAKADRMKAGIDQVIPDDVHFQSGLAEPAHKKFREYVKPTYVSRAGVTGQGIINGHLSNLSRSYQKYRDGVEAVFANGAVLFKAQVDAAKANFKTGVAARTLLFTGTKRGQRGPAPIAALWLTGDPTTLRLMRAGDTIIEGGPYLISPETKKPGLKAMLNQRLIQAGVEIIKSSFDNAVILAQNQLTAEQIQGFVDPGLDLIPFVGNSPDSHVDYIVVDGNLYLEIKVSKM
jgi:hypothetical protein